MIDDYFPQKSYETCVNNFSFCIYLQAAAIAMFDPCVPSDNDVDQFSVAVLELLCQTRTSVHTMRLHGSLTGLALALFPIGSALNHSCALNLLLQFDGLAVRVVASIQRGILRRHCQAVGEAEDALARVFAMLGQFERAARHCRNSVAILEELSAQLTRQCWTERGCWYLYGKCQRCSVGGASCWA
jgi:hypothetical protein